MTRALAIDALGNALPRTRASTQPKLYEHERLHQARRDAADELYEALERLARDADQWSGQVEPPLPSLAQAWDALAKARGEA